MKKTNNHHIKIPVVEDVTFFFDYSSKRIFKIFIPIISIKFIIFPLFRLIFYKMMVLGILKITNLTNEAINL